MLYYSITVFAAGELGLGLTAVDTNGNPISSVQSGDIIEYIIDYSCADLTDGCGDLTITFDLDLALVELVEVITSPSYSNSYTAPTITITNNVATNPTFDGGESAQARIRVRVLDGLTGNETIPSSVTGEVDNGETRLVQQLLPRVSLIFLLTHLLNNGVLSKHKYHHLAVLHLPQMEWQHTH